MHTDKLALKQNRVSIVSPLRYPGSKRRLAGHIQQILNLNGCHPALFVEPFAGGSSVALQLLNDRVVERIGLIELDPLVAAFWKTVFFDADWLVNQVKTIEVSLEQWDKFKNTVPKGIRDRALACLFLNRTSFSGILARAGPIGGRQQKSAYSLDCRFPRETLVKRIRQAEALKERVEFVWNVSWRNGLARIKQMQKRGTLPADVFFYFDPPFFEKADQLYRYYFNDAGHRQLRDAVLALEASWILSYDSLEQIKKLYSCAEFRSIQVELLYSTGRCAGNRVAQQEVILTNLPLLMSETSLWQQQEHGCKRTKSFEAASTGSGMNQDNSHQQLEMFNIEQAFQKTLDNQEAMIER